MAFRLNVIRFEFYNEISSLRADMGDPDVIYIDPMRIEVIETFSHPRAKSLKSRVSFGKLGTYYSKLSPDELKAYIETEGQTLRASA